MTSRGGGGNYNREVFVVNGMKYAANCPHRTRLLPHLILVPLLHFDLALFDEGVSRAVLPNLLPPLVPAAQGIHSHINVPFIRQAASAARRVSVKS